MLGYNGYWVTIEARCYTPTESARGLADTMVNIPNNQVVQNNGINVNPAAAPFLDAAPSRDVSATSSSSYGLLFLVADAPFATQGPQLQVASLSQTGVVSLLANSPSTGAVASSNQVPSVSCSTTSNPNCMIELGDSRPTSVILQTANDGFHYLMSSYAAEDASTVNGEVMYYVARAETLGGQSPLWTTWWIGGFGSGSASYPTITMDEDIEFAYSFQTFDAGSNQQPYNNWYEAKGFNSAPLLGYGISNNQTSSSNYTGCSTVALQR